MLSEGIEFLIKIVMGYKHTGVKNYNDNKMQTTDKYLQLKELDYLETLYGFVLLSNTCC